MIEAKRSLKNHHPSPGRQTHVDQLRGIAALIVCLCHFKGALPVMFQQILAYGDTGVQIFFVISGYIVPLSMYRSGYAIGRSRQFWERRLRRLHPPLLVALLITFALSQAAAFVKDTEPLFELRQLVPSFFYLFLPSENPVIWTLLVELKFYLFVSIAFPLLYHSTAWIRRLTIVTTLVVAGFGAGTWDVLVFLPYFLAGIAASYYTLNLASLREVTAIALLTLATAAVTSGTIQLIGGAIAWLLIVHARASTLRVMTFFGAISYSLYLLHFPIGVKFLNLSMPHVPDFLHPLLMVIALAGSIGIATLFHRWIEVPSIRWSARVVSSRRQNAGKRPP